MGLKSSPILLEDSSRTVRTRRLSTALIVLVGSTSAVPSILKNDPLAQVALVELVEVVSIVAADQRQREAQGRGHDVVSG